nr:ATPase subunits 6 [Paraulopus oblongus]
MMLNIFDQFVSPVALGIPLIAIALLIPCTLLPEFSSHWMKNRSITLMAHIVQSTASTLCSPINPRGHKWALSFVCLIYFLISLNMFGLFPYTFTPTTQLCMNLGLAFPLWLATVLIGLRKSPTEAAAHLLPEGAPPLLIPILIVIETISLFIRPIALGVRLTANLTAGHLLIQLTSSAAFVLMPISPTLALSSSVLLILLTMLELAVAMIQGYVFVLLLSLYLQENV